MNLYDRLKTRDSQIADQTAGGGDYFTLSPTRASLARVLPPAIQKHIRGVCLDAGAGRMAYRRLLAPRADEVVTLDWQPRPGLDIAGSVMELPLRDECLDSVLCSQVLEHVPDPAAALREFHRCLRPGGALVLSVPHLAYLHNEPHDYFRYTKHGLRVLLERAGFDTVSIEPAGGLLSFLGHIPSLTAKAAFARIPVLGACVMAANRVYSQAVAWADARFDPRKLFALNYVAVARKPGGEG